MRKSEAIKIIEDAIADTIDYTYLRGTFINCEEILARLLKAGMQPNCIGDLKPACCNEDVGMCNFGWEPEDDE